MLTNLSSDRISRIRHLARRSARLASGSLLVEGPQACREAACQGLVSDLYWEPRAAERYPAIGLTAEAAGGFLHLASAEYVAAISGDAQGIVAVARDPWAGLDLTAGLGLTAGLCLTEGLGSTAELEPEVDRSRSARPDPANPPDPVNPPDGGPDRRDPLVAVFEQLRDPGNAGAVIRSADAAGASLVVLADQSVDPASPKVIRASAGSYFHLPVISAGPVVDWLEQLRQADLSVYAADGSAEEVLGSPALPWNSQALAGPLAWLFGNEARGLSQSALAAADRAVRIPLFGQAESLNVAMAATLCLYAAAAARREIVPYAARHSESR